VKANGPLSIYWQAANGSGVVERLTTAEEGTTHWPDSWSSDGRTLSFSAFSTGAGVDGSIWTLSLDEGGETTLFFDLPESSERLSQFSPDGRWLAYTANAGGSLEVFVQPFPATSARYQVTQGGGAHPGWAHDGTEIFYRHPTSRTVRVVDVATDSGFSFGTERELPMAGNVTFNDSRDYDITPDGQQFLMIFEQGKSDSPEFSTPQINVVLNWFEELKRLVPTDN
jgi:Tol biopolymer transport system component